MKFFNFLNETPSRIYVFYEQLDPTIVFVFCVEEKGVEINIWEVNSSFINRLSANEITFLEFLLWYENQSFYLKYIQSTLDKKKVKKSLKDFLQICENTLKGE